MEVEVLQEAEQVTLYRFCYSVLHQSGNGLNPPVAAELEGQLLRYSFRAAGGGSCSPHVASAAAVVASGRSQSYAILLRNRRRAVRLSS